jgi:multidrug efflux pump subunit AcrA (membrane-fusion protein)
MNSIGNSARHCFLISVFIMPVLDGCSTKAASPNAPPPMNVGVVDVIEKDVPIYGDWVATLDGNVNANIQPQVSGYLVKQNYVEGSFVHKDEVLFEIDPRPFQTGLDQAKAQLAQARGQVAQAQAQLALAEINVKRDTPLAAARAIAQSQLDNDIQANISAQATTSSESLGDGKWWEVYQDQELQKLIRKALTKTMTCASRRTAFCRRSNRRSSFARMRIPRSAPAQVT